MRVFRTERISAMARQFCWSICVAVVFLVSVRSGTVTRPDGVTNELQSNTRNQQQKNQQVQQWLHQQGEGQTQWPVQEQSQGQTQWPVQEQSQGQTQWPVQEQSQGQTQWPVQEQSQGQTQWPVQEQSQGQTQWPVQEQSQGQTQWPVQEQSQGQTQWPVQEQSQGQTQWPVQEQSQGQTQWPVQEQSQGQTQWPVQEHSHGQAQWPVQEQSQGQVQWPGQEQFNHEQSQGEAQAHETEHEKEQVEEHEHDEGEIEEEEWEVPKGGAPSEGHWAPVTWAWEPTLPGQQPVWEAKQPLLHGQSQGSLAPSSNDLERVLSDTRLRWPVTVLVDTDPASLYITRRQWAAVGKDALPHQEFELVTFNDTRAASAAESRRLRGVEALQQALEALGGSAASARGAAFLALLEASQRSPHQSAVLLFTGRPSTDENYGSLAAQELHKKGCRLFVWWSGARRFSGSGAERLYREAAEHTRGAFYDTSALAPQHPAPGARPSLPDKQPFDVLTTESALPPEKRPDASPWHQEQPEIAHMQVILAARQGLHGPVYTPVLVDSSVQEIRVIVLGHVSRAYLRSPSGTVIDLRQSASDAATGTGDDAGATAAAAGGLLERRLNTRGERPGLWQLATDDHGGSTGAGAGAGYDVIVKGTSGLRIDLHRPAAEAWLDEHGDIVVTVQGGPQTNITGLVLLDNKGNELKKTYYKQRIRRENDRQIIELSVPHNALQLQQRPGVVPHYVQVNGFNGGLTGEAFTRITPQIPVTRGLITKLNSASTLVIKPETQSQVYLDIINNGSRPTRIMVYGSSTRNILYRIIPNSLQLNPNQRKTISLQLYAPANTIGLEETVKIQVHGELTISELFLQINIADNTYVTRDTNKPSLKRRILNNCKDIQSCSSKQWTMEATVEDAGSGIRDITSQPEGIIWSPMVIGTKLPVTIKYRASCCDESVNIVVSDLQNNIARYTINANEGTGLSPGAIAGIAVGAVVLLIIIIAIIVIVVCKKKKTTHTFQTQQVAR